MSSGRQTLKYAQSKADQFSVGDSPRTKVLSKYTADKPLRMGYSSLVHTLMALPTLRYIWKNDAAEPAGAS